MAFRENLDSRSIMHQLDLSMDFLSSLPAWCGEALRDFRSTISDSAFPCFYAAGSNLYFSFVNSIRLDREAVAKYLEQYIAILKSFQASEAALAARTLLVIFEMPRGENVDMDAYERDTWELLQFLLNSDRQPWPKDIPSDPDTPKWEFCFGGSPLFVNVCTPSHVHRRSRNLGSSLALVVQGREGIDYCAPPTAEGDRTREAIRSRLDQYDRIVRCPDLNVYGSESNREWKLYFLSDDNVQRTTSCPIRRTPHRDT
jgi:FPC/CPF motif-containing protein YcgG